MREKFPPLALLLTPKDWDVLGRGLGRAGKGRAGEVKGRAKVKNAVDKVGKRHFPGC